MIQRIQTLYLFLGCVLCMACLCTGIGHFSAPAGDSLADMYNLWITFEDGTHSFFPWALFVLLVLVATISFLAIFMFRRRAFQMRVTTFCIILLVGWYIVYGVFAYLLCDKMDATFRPGWTAALPAVGIVLFYLAFRGIMKDEMLVRSLDRLR